MSLPAPRILPPAVEVSFAFFHRFMVASAVPDDVAGAADLRRSCVREGIVLLKSERSRSSLRAEILDKVTVDAIVF